jgi:hypothetical protein
MKKKNDILTNTFNKLKEEEEEKLSISLKLMRLEQENKELKNDIWNWEKKYKLLLETYTEFLNHVNSK